MPGRDGTGPDGRGPMTGRKAGRCGGGRKNDDTGRQEPGNGASGGRRGGPGNGPRDGSGRAGRFTPPYRREDE